MFARTKEASFGFIEHATIGRSKTLLIRVYPRSSAAKNLMKFTRYSKFKGLDVSGINLGDLMEGLSDSLLDSGYDDDYYWTRQRRPQDTSLDALRRALLQALMDQGLLDERQIQEMLADNEGKFKGSLLEEMLNQLIERLVEEGYLTLKEEPQQQQRRPSAGPEVRRSPSLCRATSSLKLPKRVWTFWVTKLSETCSEVWARVPSVVTTRHIFPPAWKPPPPANLTSLATRSISM